ncbi:MAG: response regulator transcription factor [Bifidobacteriaceae bacterium]|nr:response regulator transcription factor [Bifidobacteriaceae bacterium]
MPKGASEESAVAAKAADEAPARPIRVLVADDQALVCNGFASIINTQGDMHAVATASTGEEAVNLSARLKPDVILMDVRMPVMDGIEATRRICSLQYDNGSTPHVIILTTFDLDEYVMSAILAGASGFLLKDTEPETLLASIRTVHEGNTIIAPSATKRLLEHMVANSRPPAQQPSSVSSAADSTVPQPTLAQGTAVHADAVFHDSELESLTAREREILVEIAHGLSNQEIAQKLYISMPTVKKHVTHILQKPHAHDRVQAAVFAFENSLV